MAEHIYHVRKKSKGWAVIRERWKVTGDRADHAVQCAIVVGIMVNRAYRIYRLKSDALMCAMRIKNVAQIVVYNEDGSLQKIIESL